MWACSSLVFARLSVCRGRFRHLRAYCSTFGLHCATVIWKRICKCSLHVTAVGGVAIVANFSADYGNLSNFEGVWLQIFWFGYLEIFGDVLKAFGSNIFGLAKCSLWPVYLSVFDCIFICRLAIFKLADHFKIHEIKWKCENFKSRSMILSDSYQIQYVCKMWKLTM